MKKTALALRSFQQLVKLLVLYRNESGHTRRKKIGVHGTITAGLARDEAKKILGDVTRYGVPSTVDTNNPTYNGTLMGQLEIKNDNNPG